jgi:hypothetical protein
MAGKKPHEENIYIEKGENDRMNSKYGEKREVGGKKKVRGHKKI